MGNLFVNKFSICKTLIKNNLKSVFRELASIDCATMYLTAFDFDQTIIQENSDIVARDMLKQTPVELEETYKRHGWTAFMQNVFDLLYEQNVTVSELESTIKKLKSVEGMVDLIKKLSCDLKNDVVIISDSNSFFIESWLTENNLNENVTKVFTNPAKIVNGRLCIEMYHLQENCKLSSKNLCKGQVLDDFIKQQNGRGVTYDKILYIGDGANDLCPILRLRRDDVAYVRESYKCHQLCTGNSAVKAEVILWKTGYDVLSHVERL